MKKKIHRWMEKYKDFSMTKKITVAFISMLVPFVILMGIWFSIMLKNNQYYSKASKSTSEISEFSLDFKKSYDYKIYLIIVGNKDFWSQKPFEDIDHARKILDKIKNPELNANSLDIIHNMEKNLDRLEKYTLTIKTNVESGSHYDENQEIWQTGVQAITASIQQYIMELLYYENQESTMMYHKINSMTVWMITISVIIICILIAIAVIMITYIPRTISRPVNELCKVTEKAAEGDLSVRSHIEHGAELKVLGKSFNVMIEKMSALIEHITLEQTRLREAELEILQMQINPHFLYNTLDTIVWLAEAGDNDQVVNMVEVLSDFFRATLNGGKEIVTIEEESRHISSYLQIQQVRYKDILDYSIQLPDEIAEVKIPKITLQPLVENALYHGIKNKRGRGQIKVYGYLKQDICVIVIADNGKGMSRDELESLNDRIRCQKEQEKESYGLYNVNERIRLRFGEEYGIRVYSELDVGTRVEVYLPACLQS